MEEYELAKNSNLINSYSFENFKLHKKMNENIRAKYYNKKTTVIL